MASPLAMPTLRRFIFLGVFVPGCMGAPKGPRQVGCVPERMSRPLPAPGTLRKPHCAGSPLPQDSGQPSWPTEMPGLPLLSVPHSSHIGQNTEDFSRVVPDGVGGLLLKAPLLRDPPSLLPTGLHSSPLRSYLTEMLCPAFMTALPCVCVGGGSGQGLKPGPLCMGERNSALSQAHSPSLEDLGISRL